MSIYNFFILGKQTVRTFGSEYLRKNFFNFLGVCFFLFPGTLQGQIQRSLNNPEMTHDNIKTVQFHRAGWPIFYPLINLNSSKKFLLSFDGLGTKIKNYYYSIELKNSEWHPTGLMKSEYYRGEELNPVEDYRRSFNTTFDYVHYKVTVPDDQASILLSGNYVLKIFEDYDSDNPVLIRRFMVSEQNVKIDADVKYTMRSAGRENLQEIDFEVQHPGLTIQDPGNEVKATVMQNSRTDNAITNLPPLFFGNDQMDFNYNRQVVMEGGNEFRWIDIRSFRFQSDHIENITFSDPFYHVDVFPDYPQGDESYYYHRDFNGRYYIEVQEEQEAEVSADYAFVHFSLKWQPPLNNRKVYLIGGLTNWQLNDHNRMNYDYDNDIFKLTLLLKQGYYNYQYLVMDDDNPSGTVMPVEGSFGRTENDFLILIYYRPAGARYDRLIGTDIVNTVEDK